MSSRVDVHVAGLLLVLASALPSFAQYEVPTTGKIGLRPYKYTPRSRPPLPRQNEVRTVAKRPINSDIATEEKCARLLNYARREYEAGKIENGMKQFRQIVKAYSGTRAAEEALRILKDW